MNDQNVLHVNLTADGLVSRRNLLRIGAGGLASAGILGRLGLNAAEIKAQGRACIMVFLNGAPSQMETWDPKPGTDNGGPTKSIKTKVPGLEIAEYWPKLAQKMNDFAVIRSMAGKEAAHERGRYHLRTGRRLTGTEKFPHFGSLVAHQNGDPDSDLPNFVSIGNTISSGFLGVEVAPFVLPKAGELPANVKALVDDQRRSRRMRLLERQEADFARAGAEERVKEHQELYKKASKMMTSSRLKAFKLDGESEATKNAYGKSQFGQGLLVARRLVEAGIPFVEVQKGGWDMHDSLWQRIGNNAADVDQGVSQLMTDLKQRGLLEKTLVIVLGEFGRTPKINNRTPEVGRDHWARNFNLLIAGAGVNGGQVIGKTSENGQEIVDREVYVEDLFQSMCRCMGIDADEELYTPSGRPLKIVDGGEVIGELFS